MAQTEVINIGYWNYKGENDVIIPSRVSVAPYDEVITGLDKLKLGDVTYIIGEGDPYLEMVKTGNIFNKVLVLNMLATQMHLAKKKKETFKLLLSAPPLAYYEENTVADLRSYFIDNYHIIWNGKELDITIQDVEVLPETFVAYAHINSEDEYTDKTVYIFDIGGFATNICRVRNGNFTERDYVTVQNGMFHIDSSISHHLNQRYMKYNLNSTYEDVNDYRKNGLHFDGEDEEVDFYVKERKAIEEIAIKHINSLLFQCTTKKWNLKSGTVIVIGGGGEAVFEVIKEHFFKKAILSPTAIWDNLLGLEMCKELIFPAE